MCGMGCYPPHGVLQYGFSLIVEPRCIVYRVCVCGISPINPGELNMPLKRPKHSPMTPEEVVWAKEQVALGYTAASVAQVLGRNPETVRRAVRGDTHREAVALVDALRPKTELPESRPGERSMAEASAMSAEEQAFRNENARRIARGEDPLPWHDGAQAVDRVVSEEVVQRAKDMGAR